MKIPHGKPTLGGQMQKLPTDMPFYYVGVLVMVVGLIVYSAIDRRSDDIPLIVSAVALLMAALGQVTMVGEKTTKDSGRPPENSMALLGEVTCEAREIRRSLKASAHRATKAKTFAFVALFITALAILLRWRR